MPEGRIVLAEATAYLALAPKSNRSYVAIDRAIADVRAGKAGVVPDHLRDAHYAGAERIGHGKGYQYAHDAPHAVAAQQYLPDAAAGATLLRTHGPRLREDAWASVGSAATSRVHAWQGRCLGTTITSDTRHDLGITCWP